MANKIKEIKGFFSGIISSFSSSDIKDDAASYSENIDSTDEDGVLKGSKDDTVKIFDNSIKASIAKSVENDDETFDLITSDSNSGQINIVEDLYGNSKVKKPINNSEPGNVASSIEVKNNQAFVGYGKDINPKIVYKTKNIPFGQDAPNFSDWIYEDSTVYDKRILNSSYNVDRFVAIPGSSISNSTKAIGIRYDHQDVYFINLPASFTSDDIFDFAANPASIDLGTSSIGKNILTGGACDICQADVFEYSEAIKNLDENNNLPSYKFWVLSNSSSDTEDTNSYPLLRKFELNSDGTSITPVGGAYHTINFGEDNPPNGSAPASIIETKNYLWIQYWKPNGDKFGRHEPFLWCINLQDLETQTDVFAENKSLYYDHIKRFSQKFRLSFMKYGAQKYKEYFFRNIDEHYENLEDDNWLSGDSNWNDRERSWGGHKYSGFCDSTGATAPAIKIARHGLISSPLLNTVNGESTDYLNEQINLDLSDDNEDWVSVIGQSRRLKLNILTAEEYKVAGGQWHDSYRRLRAGDDSGVGSNILNEHFDNLLQWFAGAAYNVIDLIGRLVADFFYPIFGTGSGNMTMDFFSEIFGGDSVHWFYNGKCFESGYAENFVLNISSNHDPSKKLDVENGARVHIRELLGFDSNLEIIGVKHYFNRLMISAHNSNETNPIHNTKFFMYDTSENSLANTNLACIRVIHPDDWEEATDNKAAVPDDYLDFGNTQDGLTDETTVKFNKVLQSYIPIVDFEIHDLGSFDFNDDALIDVYPHLNVGFWTDADITINADNLANSSTVGKVYATERATFDIFLRNNACYDGRRIFNASPGWSSQDTINDHIGFLSTSGPLNISKFNFLLVRGNDTDTSQQNLPNNPDDLFPDNNKSIISLNQYPNANDDINIKQYSLSTKALSFRVKAQNFAGAGVAPFVYSDELGNLNLYRYKINLVYDGYQDSPLSNHYTEVDIRDTNVRASGVGGDDYEASSLAITVNLHKPEIMSKRITHIRLWRSTIQLHEDDTENDTFNTEGSYVLVDTIPLSSQWLVTEETVPEYDDVNAELGKIAFYTVVDNGKVGVSYEAYVGLPENMKITLPNYTLSTQLNGYLYMANCSHPSFDDASSIIFRSLPDKYSMVDWTSDFLSLPSKPRAITSFDGRVIAWDYDNMYIINPEGFYIEDTFEGSGCLGYDSFARSEQGICFADKNNIYLYDGKNVNNIGMPIITNTNYSEEVSWRNKSEEYESIIKYSSILRSFCIFFKTNKSLFDNFIANGLNAHIFYTSRSENQNLGTTIYRWYDIPGILIDWEENIETEPKYIVHRNMRDAWHIHGTYGIPGDFENPETFFDPYVYNFQGEDIVLPYGTAYEINTKRYIVDMPAFLYGVGYYNEEQNERAPQTTANVYILLEGLKPEIEDIFEDGKISTSLPAFYYSFIYNVDKKRWDLQKTNEYKGIFNGPKGELYSSQKDETEENFSLKELFSANRKKEFTYTSKTFSFTNQTVNKILSRLKIFYKNTTPKFKYILNNDDKWINPIEENITYENYCLSYQFPKENKKAKAIKIKIISGYNNGTDSYDTEVDSFSIIYRERGNV